MELATKFFEEQLQSADGARARAYLRDRGLSPATQQSFRLGYAPDSRNALKEFLAARASTKAQIEACGLVVHGDDIPVSYDRFRDRIMFPIRDSRGRIIAFGGRALSPDALGEIPELARDRALPQGQRALQFRAARARRMRKDGTVIAVEGYMDVIALAQAGLRERRRAARHGADRKPARAVLAHAGEPVLCFDGDQAGLKAAWRAADLALPLIQPGRTLRFALLPEGKDPDDLVKAEGPDAFRSRARRGAAARRPAVDARDLGRRLRHAGAARPNWKRRCASLTARIRDESVRYHYPQEMRERVQAFFGAQRAAAARQGRGRGQARRQGRAASAAQRRRGGRTPRGFGKPGALGAGQARRQRHAAARSGDRRGAGQPSGN